MGEVVTAQIVEWEQDGGVLVRAAVPNLDRAILRQYDTCLCEFQDGRTLSPEQRKKIYAILREISEFTGYTEDEAKEAMKFDFITNHLESICKAMFSLSDCDMTTARNFITFLIDFCIEHGVPTRVPMYKLCDDIERYIYACLIHKKCAVCGSDGADVHHLHGSRVGHGGLKWREKDQAGAVVIPLCRVHHTECHTDEEGFLARHHLQGIPFTKELAKVYKVKMREA